MRGLLLDIGGVVIRTPFELLAEAERVHGLASGALGPRGPFGPPGSDPDHTAVVEGTLTERAYWERRARDTAPLLGSEPTTDALMHVLFDLPRERIVRSETAALIASAERSGWAIGVLTNDLHDFHGPGWFHDLGVVTGELTALVDGSLTGHLKPAPEAYALAVEAMGLPAHELVYLDDQPVNVAGGHAAGLHAVAFDVLDPSPAISAVLDLVATTPRPAG